MSYVTTCIRHPDEPAPHKIGHENAASEGWHIHNLTAYLCCECFGGVLGSTAMGWCASGHPQVGVSWAEMADVLPATAARSFDGGPL